LKPDANQLTNTQLGQILSGIEHHKEHVATKAKTHRTEFRLGQERFGWAKNISNIRQVKVRGLQKVDQMFVLTMASYNLTRMRSLGQFRPEAAQ